jgi:ribosomal protein S18 acetylase RimI-like enzyme
MKDRIEITVFSRQDISAAVSMWNYWAETEQMIYASVTEEQFRDTFLESVHYSEEYMLAAHNEAGELVGFGAGLIKRKYLQGEDFFNTPGYITMIMVSPEWSKKGIGVKILKELEQRFYAAGKKKVRITYRNPMPLTWKIPNTSSAYHNNAPGVDMESIACHMFETQGYVLQSVEDGMYLPLANFAVTEKVQEKQSKLLDEGISIELYDSKQHIGFEELFDALHGEVWRETIRENNQKENPLPVLIAADGKNIVGFAGPIDKEANGRGWFNGIATHPDYERRGIATVLFWRLMEQFSQIGAEYSTLFTDEENPALKLYRSVGFSVAKRFAVMEKEL